VGDALARGIARAKIADFGMAIRFQNERSYASDVHRGTPFYMAPETRRDHVLSRGSDVYSFGVIMWELMMGTLVYERRSVHNQSLHGCLHLYCVP
jgi:serine/threonine protein kinase